MQSAAHFGPENKSRAWSEFAVDALGRDPFGMETSSGVRARYLKFLSGSGWIVATALELALSVICANGVAERSIGFVLALLLTIFETC